MQKFGKIIWYILTWGPLAWTILILFAAKSYSISIGLGRLMNDLEIWFIITAACYFIFGGLLLWMILTVAFRWKKIISNRQMIIAISITILGILAAYLSLHNDVWGVSGSYID